MLIGTQTNVEVVVSLHNRLSSIAAILCGKAWIAYCAKTIPQFRVKRTAFNVDFYQGFSDGIYWRLKEQSDAASASSSMALVVATKEELRKEQLAYHGRELTRQKIKHDINDPAYQSGHRAAQGVEIHPLVTEQ